MNSDAATDTAASIGEESDPPTSVEDIPLSRAGALYLFTARIAAAQLFNSSTSFPTFHTFPHHATVVRAFIGTDAAGGVSSAGTESPALIDTILSLGLYTLHNDAIGSPEDDDQFTQYLQVSPNLPPLLQNSSLTMINRHYLSSPPTPPPPHSATTPTSSHPNSYTPTPPISSASPSSATPSNTAPTNHSKNQP